MNTVTIENRIITQVPRTPGTLTDRGGRSVPVNFSLTESQLYANGIPGTRSAEGELEFVNLADPFDLRDVSDGVILRGAGIEAEVALLSMHAFRVVPGTLHEDPVSTPDEFAPPELTHHV